ncbi:VOC family protein [Endozoicomonas sp.]|uniref:SMU1112c/YaeR family gloxylase I-like metalloprotein n=1 Tax=Endozoicomonas sp. TaxID=1892382 RepID=UPI00383A29A9
MDFYQDLLGFEVVGEYYQEGRGSWKIDLVMSDGGQIELFIFENAPSRPSYPEARGLRHMAFEVDHLEETLKMLSENGITAEPVRVDPYTQASFTFIQDPDGLPVELYQPE